MCENMDICFICLRTDRTSKEVNTKLSYFHSELCGLSIKEPSPAYCCECEHLLRKMYNFKTKCRKAMEILQGWIQNKAVKKYPISNLCKLIPTTLQYSQSNNQNIYKYEEGLSECNNQSKSLDVTVSCENQDLLENNLTNNEIKQEINDTKEIQEKDILILKNEELAQFEEILLNNETNDNVKINDIQSNDTTINDIVAGDSEIDEILQDINFSSDDNETLLSVMKKTKKTKEKHRQKNTKKRYNDSEVNDNENDLKYIKKRKSGDINEKTDLVKKNKNKLIVPKITIEGSNKKIRFHTRKDIIAELTNDLDTKHENGIKRKPKSYLKKPFTKERLIEELESRFSSCGELVSSDGTVIDKEFVLKCLYDKTTEFLMKQLYQAVYRKSDFKPKALKLFKCIQNRYKTEYESVFDIEYLNTKEKMIEEFEKRLSYPSYIMAEFKCEICYQGFKHEKKLQYHLKCHDKSTGERECSICKMRFRTKKALINHLRSHEAVYKCKQCPLVTYYKSCMKNHYEQHKGIKYKCEQCNSTFQSVSAYRTHVSYRHARAHVCTTCGRAFSTRIGLRAHCTKYHQNETPATDSESSVKCSECYLTLVSWDAYQRHLRLTHKQAGQKGRPPGSTNSTSRARNSSLPRKRPVMTCRVCNSVGDSVGWLQLHFAENHPSVDMSQLYADKHTHLCHVCGKSFSTIYTLQAHLNIHDGVRPYACDVCSARFHRQISLRLHKQVHKPPSKPCVRCGKKFRSSSNLNNHMRSHIGDRRYKCNICGKGFIHRNSVNEHVRGVHKNIRRVRKRGVTDIDRGHNISVE